MAGQSVVVEVEGRQMALSNLDKVLFPRVGLTKGEVLAYYQEVSPVLLPHLADKCVTRVRMPDGMTGPSFFEKNAPAGAPEWLRTQRVRHDEVTDYVLVEDLPTLVHLANLASIELHVPQWRVADAERRDGDVVLDPEPRVRTVVVDLDPGPGITMVEEAHAALLCASLLAADGLEPFVKTSGSKGLQVYAPVAPTPADQTLAYVRGLGERVAAQHPDRFVLTQTRTARKDRILVDYLQNKAARTTVAPYSLRGRDGATCSTPVTWDEVAAVTSADDLRFTTADVLARVAEHGDLFAPLLTDDHPPLPVS